MYRDREHAVIAGVCAGFADALGIGRVFVRLVAVIALLLHPALTLLAYLLLALLIKPSPSLPAWERRARRLYGQHLR